MNNPSLWEQRETSLGIMNISKIFVVQRLQRGIFMLSKRGLGEIFV